MKLLTVFLLGLFLIACSEEEKKIEIYNPEAFAFRLDSGWELNASAGLRNYVQTENEGVYRATVDFHINLITPTDTIPRIDFGTLDETRIEEILELGIESQIELDTGFIPGNYKLIFIAEDTNNFSSDTASVSFELSDK